MDVREGERESCLVECERTRARECERTTVDSESHLASRLLFIVPCYSGFPRQSGRDAVKKKINDRKENGNVKMKGRGKKLDEKLRKRMSPMLVFYCNKIYSHRKARGYGYYTRRNDDAC